MVKKIIRKITRKHLERITQGIFLLLLPLGVVFYYPNWWVPINNVLTALGQPNIEAINDVAQQQSMLWRPEDIVRSWLLVGILGIVLPAVGTIIVVGIKREVMAYKDNKKHCPVESYLSRAGFYLNLFGLGQVVRHLLLMALILLLPQLLFGAYIKLPLDLIYSLLGSFMGYCLLVEVSFCLRSWHSREKTARVVDDYLGLKQALITYLHNTKRTDSVLQSYLYYHIVNKLKRTAIRDLFSHKLYNFSFRRLFEQLVLVNISALLLSLTLPPLAVTYSGESIPSAVEANEVYNYKESKYDEIVSQLISEDEQSRQLLSESDDGIFMAAVANMDLEKSKSLLDENSDGLSNTTDKIDAQINKKAKNMVPPPEGEQALGNNNSQVARSNFSEKASIQASRDLLAEVQNIAQYMAKNTKLLNPRQETGTVEGQQASIVNEIKEGTEATDDFPSAEETLATTMSNEIENIVEDLKVWQNELAQSMPGVRYGGKSQLEIFVGGEGSYVHPAKVIRGHSEHDKDLGEDWKIRLSGQSDSQNHERVVNLAKENGNPLQQQLADNDKRAARESQIELLGASPDQSRAQVEQAKGRSRASSKMDTRRPDLAKDVEDELGDKESVEQKQFKSKDFSPDNLYSKSSDDLKDEDKKRANSTAKSLNKKDRKLVGINLDSEKTSSKEKMSKPELYAAFSSQETKVLTDIPDGEAPEKTLSSKKMFQDVSSLASEEQVNQSTDLDYRQEIIDSKGDSQQLAKLIGYAGNYKNENIQKNEKLDTVRDYDFKNNDVLSNQEALQIQNSISSQLTLQQQGNETREEKNRFSENVVENHNNIVDKELNAGTVTAKETNTSEQAANEAFTLSPEPEEMELAIQEGLGGFDKNKRQTIAMMSDNQQDTDKQQRESRLQSDIPRQTVLNDLSSLGQGADDSFMARIRNELQGDIEKEQLTKQKINELAKSNRQMEKVRKELTALAKKLTNVPVDLQTIKQSQTMQMRKKDTPLFQQYFDESHELLSQAKDLSQRVQDLSRQIGMDENQKSNSLSLRTEKELDTEKNLKQKTTNPEKYLSWEEGLRQQALARIDYFLEDLEPLFLLKEAQPDNMPNLTEDQKDSRYKSGQRRNDAVKPGKGNRNRRQSKKITSLVEESTDFWKQLSKTFRENKKVAPRNNDTALPRNSWGQQRASTSMAGAKQVESDFIASPSPSREFPHAQQQSSFEDEIRSPYMRGEEDLSREDVFAKVIRRLRKHQEKTTEPEVPSAPKVSAIKNDIQEQPEIHNLSSKATVANANLPDRSALTVYELKHPFQGRDKKVSIPKILPDNMNYIVSKQEKSNLWSELPIKGDSNFSTADFTTTKPSAPRNKSPKIGVSGADAADPVTRQLIPKAYKNIIKRLYQARN